MHPLTAAGERACKHAIESTPEKYLPFITILENRTNVAPRGQREQWVSVRTPYMQVDGRVSMAVDEHRVQGATIAIQTEIVEIKDD